MTFRSWVRMVCWELAKLAVIAAVVGAAWNYASPRPRCTIVGDHCPLHLSADGERLLTVTYRKADPDWRLWTRGPLRVWNARTGEQVTQFLAEDAVWAWSSPNRERVVFATPEKLQAVDWRAGTIVTSPRPAHWSDKNSDRLEMGDIVVVGSTQGYSDLTILDASTGAVLDRLAGRFFASSAYCVRAGSCLAAARSEQDGQLEILLWDRAARKTTGTLPINGVPVAISPDGQRIVVAKRPASSDELWSISVWKTDPAVREPLRKLGSFGTDPTSVHFTFSPDGTHLFMAPNPVAGTAILWNVDSDSRKRIIELAEAGPVGERAAERRRRRQALLLALECSNRRGGNRQAAACSGTVSVFTLRRRIWTSVDGVILSAWATARSPSTLHGYRPMSKIVAGRRSNVRTDQRTIRIWSPGREPNCSSRTRVSGCRRTVGSASSRSTIGPCRRDRVLCSRRRGDWIADDGALHVRWNLSAALAGSMIVAIFACWIAVFAAERLVRHLRKRSSS